MKQHTKHVSTVAILQKRPDMMPAQYEDIGALGSILGPGVFRPYRLGHGRGTGGVGLLDLLVVKQHGLQALAQARAKQLVALGHYSLVCQ